MDERLSAVPWFAGPEYSIADIAIYPWTRSYEQQGVDINNYPKLHEWQEKMAAREGVKRGMELLRDHHREMSSDDKKVLFGRR